MGLTGRVSRAMLCGLALAWAVPAAAQFSDSFNFLKAVRDSDGDKAVELIGKNASVLNTRDPTTGETALHIVIKQHNDNWVAYLIGKGASYELRDREGNTALLTAAAAGDTAAAGTLLRVFAKVNAANTRGETPLILAVQRRDIVMVRQLLDAGADPKIADNFTGRNALEYAAADSRAAAIAKVLADAKPGTTPTKQVSGPVR